MIVTLYTPYVLHIMGRPWNEVILLGTHPAHPVYWFDFTFRYISDGFTFQIYFRWFYFSDDFQILSKWHISISDGFSWLSDGFTHIFGFRWFSDSDDFQMEKDMPPQSIRKIECGARESLNMTILHGYEIELNPYIIYQFFTKKVIMNCKVHDFNGPLGGNK